MEDSAVQIVLDLAGQDPFEPVVYGQGSTGKRCKFCLATDYYGSIQHTASCIWQRAVDHYRAKRR